MRWWARQLGVWIEQLGKRVRLWGEWALTYPGGEEGTRKRFELVLDRARLEAAKRRPSNERLKRYIDEAQMLKQRLDGYANLRRIERALR